MTRRRHRDQDRTWALVAIGIVTVLTTLLSSCNGNHKEPTTSGSSSGSLEKYISTMDEADFHAIGVAAEAPQLGPGVEIAPALNTTDTELQAYVTSVCGGTKPTLMAGGLIAFPKQVPAYEALFAYIDRQCPQTTLLDGLRGQVATSIAYNEDLLGRLSDQSTSSQFCDDLAAAEQLTSFVISAAAQKANLDETASKLLELGVGLMVKECRQLLGRVTPG